VKLASTFDDKRVCRSRQASKPTTKESWLVSRSHCTLYSHVLFSHLNNNVTSKGKRCNRSVTLRLARSQQRRVELVTETRRQRTEVNPPRRAAPTKKQQRGRRRAGYHITKLSLFFCSMVGERAKQARGGSAAKKRRNQGF
jgi:hypothetical protein